MVGQVGVRARGPRGRGRRERRDRDRDREVEEGSGGHGLVATRGGGGSRFGAARWVGIWLEAEAEGLGEEGGEIMRCVRVEATGRRIFVGRKGGAVYGGGLAEIHFGFGFGVLVVRRGGGGDCCGCDAGREAPGIK